jgi:NADH:ubiquinone oxidoreductase subunit 3 (subunit A)
LFLYPWAVAMRHAETADAQATTAATARGLDLAVADGCIANRGLIFAGAMVFILLVVLGFVYDWRKGVFRWR